MIFLSSWAKRWLAINSKQKPRVFTEFGENLYEVVTCVDEHGIEIARSLVNCSAEEAGKIAGQASDKIESILGYVDEAELIHRDNMALV